MWNYANAWKKTIARIKKNDSCTHKSTWIALQINCNMQNPPTTGMYHLTSISGTRHVMAFCPECLKEKGLTIDGADVVKI